ASVMNRESISDLDSLPRDIDEVPIKAILLPGFERILLPPVRMKQQRAFVPVPRAGGMRAQAGPYVLRTQVFHLDSALALERHHPQTGHASAGINRSPPVTVRIEADARTEEVTRGTPHGRFAIE